MLGHGLAEWFRERMQGNGDMDEMMFGPQISIGFPNLCFVICGLLTPKFEKDLARRIMSPGVALN